MKSRPEDGVRWVIPHHAQFRCAQRARVSMQEAVSTINSVIDADDTEWRPSFKGTGASLKKCDGVLFGKNDRVGVIVVAKDNMLHEAPHWCVLSVYGWDPIAKKAVS